VSVTIEVWPKVFHVWQLAAGLIPESRKAVDNAVAFVNAAWA
jgi:acetyl esterase/lipase